MSRRVLVLNGPNLNLLGSREPDVYGSDTLDDIMKRLEADAAELGCAMRHEQTNSEGRLVDLVQEARHGSEPVDGIVLNAGAYTHTSVAVRDAIAGTGLPVVEIHVSNVYAREAFRHTSLLAPVCVGVVCGFGSDGYRVALTGLLAHLDRAER